MSLNYNSIQRLICAKGKKSDLNVSMFMKKKEAWLFFLNSNFFNLLIQLRMRIFKTMQIIYSTSKSMQIKVTLLSLGLNVMKTI